MQVKENSFLACMPCGVLVVMCYNSLHTCILASLFLLMTGSSAAGSGLNICSWCFHHFLSSACIVHFVLEVALVTTNYCIVDLFYWVKYAVNWGCQEL